MKTCNRKVGGISIDLLIDHSLVAAPRVEKAGSVVTSLRILTKAGMMGSEPVEMVSYLRRVCPLKLSRT